ncbi:hypothetical protein VTK26DRAFT_7942 [Humicola hyalothermophila]
MCSRLSRQGEKGEISEVNNPLPGRWWRQNDLSTIHYTTMQRRGRARPSLHRNFGSSISPGHSWHSRTNGLSWRHRRSPGVCARRLQLARALLWDAFRFENKSVHTNRTASRRQTLADWRVWTQTPAGTQTGPPE